MIAHAALLLKDTFDTSIFMQTDIFDSVQLFEN